MPYVTKTAREIYEYRGEIPTTSGELNFLLTDICKQYIESKVTISYDVFNSVIGVLACCIQELYRRVVAPYEDLKCRQHGDVYNLNTRSQ